MNYKDFAYVYDELMNDVEYDQWVQNMEKLFQKYQVQPKSICDIGCGTGNITIPLAQKGYRMTGIDLSADMITVAQEKAKAKELSIQWKVEDMREMELGTTYDAVISLCDSMNYILEGEELLDVFHGIYEILEDDGICIFDINTFYKYSEVLKQNNFVDHSENVTYIWENYFDENEEINEYNVTFFIKEQDGKYGKVQETHEQKAYHVEEIETIIRYADFSLLGCFDADTLGLPTQKSTRIYFVIKKNLENL